MPTSRERRRRLLEAARLYFVCEGRPAGRSPIPLLDAALRGGAGIIQLREKSHRSADELIALAGPFSRAAAAHGALFILNDRPDLVAACGAQGAGRPDQLSVGPIWETPTKQGRQPTGLGLIEHAASVAAIPWFAIGGIDTTNVAEVAATGARRIVVVRAIRDAQDPEAAARSLYRALDD